MPDRLAMLQKMVEGGSGDPFHWYALAMEYRSSGRLEDALASYGDVRTRFPDYVPTYLMGGQVALELSRPEDARAWLEDGLTVAKRMGEGKAVTEIQALLDTI